jgi:hypothetical protein
MVPDCTRPVCHDHGSNVYRQGTRQLVIVGWGHWNWNRSQHSGEPEQDSLSDDLPCFFNRSRTHSHLLQTDSTTQHETNKDFCMLVFQLVSYVVNERVIS